MTDYTKEWRSGERKQRLKIPNFESKVGSNATKRNRKFSRTGLGWEVTGLGLINERHRKCSHIYLPQSSCIKLPNTAHSL